MRKNKEKEEVTLKVASLIPPMTEILELVKPKLAEEAINLEMVVLGDNVQPNTALAAKEVDVNFFQHVPYMEEFNRNNDAELSSSCTYLFCELWCIFERIQFNGRITRGSRYCHCK